MKRRIIKQGLDSHTITLPKTWIKEFNIKSGQEVDVVQKERSVVITADFVAEKKAKRIELSLDMDPGIFWRMINAAYVTGYQEMIIFVKGDDKPKQCMTFADANKLLYRIVDSLIGMEIVEQTKERTMIKELAALNQNEFEDSFKRMFFILESMMQEATEGLKQDDKQKILSAISTDHTLNRFTLYCMRLLNLFGYADYSKTVDVYKIVNDLEQLGDEITQYLENAKSPDKKEIDVFEKTVGLLRQAYVFMHKKDLEGIALPMTFINETLHSKKYSALGEIYEQLREIYQGVLQVIV